jgi:ubiquinone/menaquinone biosynthesis C-methylase UbiE
MGMENLDMKAVKNFWENNPLFFGESQFLLGSKEFFDEHNELTIRDCFAGKVNDNIFPKNLDKKYHKVLDAGCGIGFWLQQFGERDFTGVTGIDLSRNSLNLAKQRNKFEKLNNNLIESDLETLPFKDKIFDHVNCQGVIHHTLNPQTAVKEIYRVLRPGGTASLSLYYKNFFLRNFEVLKPFIRIFGRLGLGLRGRGRESILLSESTAELVRKYDGYDNPIGISFSLTEVEELFEKFEIKETFLFYFPRRVFNFIPIYAHSICSKFFGFMIHVSLVKKELE